MPYSYNSEMAKSRKTACRARLQGCSESNYSWLNFIILFKGIYDINEIVPIFFSLLICIELFNAVPGNLISAEV